MGSFHMTQRLPAQQPAHRLLGHADRRHRRCRSPTASRRQAPAQLDGADAGVQDRAPTAARGDFVHGAPARPAAARSRSTCVKTLVGALDWGLDAQQATRTWSTSAPANSPTTNVGGEHPNIDTANNGANDPLVTGLRALGHTVSTGAQSSGVNTIMRSCDGRQPALDRRHRSAPRRRRARRHVHALSGGAPSPSRARRCSDTGGGAAHSLAFRNDLAQVAHGERELGPTPGSRTNGCSVKSARAPRGPEVGSTEMVLR